MRAREREVDLMRVAILRVKWRCQAVIFGHVPLSYPSAQAMDPYQHHRDHGSN